VHEEQPGKPAGLKEPREDLPLESPLWADEALGMLRTFWRGLRTVLIALFLFVGIRTFVIEAFRIPSSSMEGTLLVGDVLLVNKMVYGAEIPGTPLKLPALDEPDREDLVLFMPHHDSLHYYVKRVVGLGGDTLEMKDRILMRNGMPVDEPYLNEAGRIREDYPHPAMKWQVPFLAAGTDPETYQPSRDTWGPIVVPPGSVFVLGDNRDNSEDSRYWGFVELDQLKGRPWRIYYSVDQRRRSESPYFDRVRWDRIGELVR
jgi:signal peptidase I